LLGVPQGLWYSHSHPSPTFKIGKRLVNRLFTSVHSAIPTQSSKVRAVGHGIDVKSFALKANMSLVRQGICSVGRIAPIKNLDQVIIAVSSLAPALSNQLSPIFFVGPIRGKRDSEYQVELFQLSKSLGVEVTFFGTVIHEYLPDLFGEYLIQFSATPGGVDKSVLEGAASGCFIVSTNQIALQESGMTHVFGKSIERLSVPEQIENIFNLRPELLAEYRRNLSEYVLKRHDVNETMQRIALELISLR
jgi:glycosyltransferase involved in cell wall biosynthesis